jgi:hypothetical protein
VSLFPWSRSPYDWPDLDDGPRAVLLPSGALIEPEQLRINKELGRRQDAEIKARAEEREAAARAALAETEVEKATERETIKREVLDDLRDAGVLPPG